MYKISEVRHIVAKWPERERGAFDLERLGGERAIKGGDVASADGDGDTV